MAFTLSIRSISSGRGGAADAGPLAGAAGMINSLIADQRRAELRELGNIDRS
jgi:hypothetical protein